MTDHRPKMNPLSGAMNTDTLKIFPKKICWFLYSNLFIVCISKFRIDLLCRKSTVFIMPTMSPQVTSQVVITTTCDATYEDKVGIMTTPGFIITMTSQWAWWRLRSPASRLFTQPFIRVQIKENIKAPRRWPLCGEFTGDRWIPRINDQ